MVAALRSALLIALSLAACDSESPVSDAILPSTAQADDSRADCAIGPGARWARDCLIEQGEDKAILTVRHPDGGFRRLRIVRDGRGVVPADGAEEARVTVAGYRSIEVTIGEDRYRLPATLAAPAR